MGFSLANPVFPEVPAAPVWLGVLVPPFVVTCSSSCSAQSHGGTKTSSEMGSGGTPELLHGAGDSSRNVLYIHCSPPGMASPAQSATGTIQEGLSSFPGSSFLCQLNKM